MNGPWGSPTPRSGPPSRKASRLGLAVWLGALILCGLVLYALDRAFPGSLSDADGPYIVRSLAVLALMSSGLLFVRDMNLKQTARNVGLWLAVGAVLVVGFAYQDELSGVGRRLRSTLMPGYAVETGTQELEIAEGEGGSYVVYGAVNGVPMRFLIDTGASDVVLTPSDAKKLGMDLDRLRYDRPYGTANGIGYGAAVTLDELTVGGIRMTGVQASVNKTEIGPSLLGMSFLRQLKSFGFSNRRLVLKW